MTRWFHGISRDLLRAAFSEYFGLSRVYIDVIVLLYERPYESVPIKKLSYLLNSHRPPSAGVIHERIRVLREVMDAESIDSGGRLNPEGYRLTELGYRECQVALGHMAEILTTHVSGTISSVDQTILQALPAPEEAA